MKRIAPLILFGFFVATLAFAQQSVTKISLTGQGKSVEGGIAVNPVTHKAYVIAELDVEGADDEKVVFVIDDKVLGDVMTAPKKVHLPLETTISPLKFIHIANEQEYITIDSTKNLIYVATKFSVEQEESDTDGEGGGEAESPGGDGADSSGGDGTGIVTPILGTLTVIDGNTDTAIAVYKFPNGVEPEGVAVDPVTSIVYVAAKAPEGEAAADNYCSSGTAIYDVGEPGDVECWTPGKIYAFYIDPAATSIITYLMALPAGDDPESIVFENGMVYGANEDDGTITVASAVYPDKTGGVLLTAQPTAPTQPYALGLEPYSLGVFFRSGPNPLACVENKFEADKMAAGGGSVFITDDRSRVAKITGTTYIGWTEIPGASKCEDIPNTDGGGLNTANNVAFMPSDDGGRGFLYVLSEQNTLAVLDPGTMQLKAVVTIPEAVHLDGIAVDAMAHRIWMTDEVLQAVFVLQGSCVNGTRGCKLVAP